MLTSDFYLHQHRNSGTPAYTHGKTQRQRQKDRQTYTYAHTETEMGTDRQRQTDTPSEVERDRDREPGREPHSYIEGSLEGWSLWHTSYRLACKLGHSRPQPRCSVATGTWPRNGCRWQAQASEDTDDNLKTLHQKTFCLGDKLSWRHFSYPRAVQPWR